MGLIGLAIRNLAIVEAQSLELGDGLTVLTGETGAGKSILIDALSMSLGQRADRALVRAGAERCEVSAEFELSGHSPGDTWLSEQELESDGQCLLRRVIGADGRSRGYINGTPATAQQLQGLGQLLVDIHAQNAHQSLTRADEQRRLLDAFGGLSRQAKKTADAWQQWRQQSERLQTLRDNAGALSERRDLLSFQLQELDALALADGEFEQLTATHARLAHIERLQQGCWQTLEQLDGEHSGAINPGIANAAQQISELTRIDDGLQNIVQLLETAGIQLGEAVTELRHYTEALEDDPEQRQQINQRVDETHRLARKHQCRPEALPELHQKLAAELDSLSASAGDLDGLEAEVEQLRGTYETLANDLSARRTDAAATLSNDVTDQLAELGMPAANFSVELAPIEGGSQHGNEAAQFLFQANPGQPAGPMHKVASGGELSRLSLAVRVATLSGAAVGTLVFDEVDVGIGGKVAEQVGRLLRRLAEDRQVLCITHLPQVAVHGRQHIRIDKQTDGDSTHTTLTQLNDHERAAEIARMLGGLEITDQTQAHANEMLARASNAA